MLLLVTTGLSAVGVVTPFVWANTTSQLSFQIQPSSSTINAGAFAKFAMLLVYNSTANVALVAKGVPADSVAIFNPNAGTANPAFNSTLTIITSPATPAHSYVVMAVAIVNGLEVTDNVTLQVLAPVNTTSSASNTTSTTFESTLVMRVTTDRPVYQANSTVNIQGEVTDFTGSAVANATVSVQVDASSGAQAFLSNNLQTDSAGAFEADASLPSNAPSGTYTVFTSATKLGYAGTTTQTTFVVGTSTTPSVVIKMVYAGDSAGNPSSIFTPGRTIWIWLVIQNIGPAFQGVIWIQVRDPSGIPVQIQIHVYSLEAGQTVRENLGFSLLPNATIGVYTVNALISDKLISQGGTFLASSQTQFALVG